MGTPSFAKNIMQALVEREKYDVVAAYTKEDAIRGRGKSLVASPVKDYAISQNVPVETPSKFTSTEIETLKAFRPDFICVAAYGLILPKEVLGLAKASLNVHGSLLPKWRGAAPVQRAILAGDEKTGITIMKMNEGMDTGDYASQAEVEIGNKNVNEIFDEFAKVGATELMNVLDNFETVEWLQQDESLVTYADKLEKKELWLKNSDSAAQVLRKIKASSKEAPAKCQIAGRIVTILDASLEDEKLKVLRLRPDGKNEMN